MESGAAPVKAYARRSGRIPRRANVILHRRDPEGRWTEIPAETRVLSRHGCLVACPARLKLGDEVLLWSPERVRGVQARVVFRPLSVTTHLVDIGFEFLDSDDFWAIEFPGVT